ncbi:hypothetical protein A2U01_0117610, partial [Trifolium medium]|nr:hypothetical protein [Trifolium medium]
SGGSGGFDGDAGEREKTFSGDFRDGGSAGGESTGFEHKSGGFGGGEHDVVMGERS